MTGEAKKKRWKDIETHVLHDKQKAYVSPLLPRVS